MIPEEAFLAIDQAGKLLRTARYAVAFTGAGISTPSGIPDFRSAGSGEWARSDPMEVASLTAFRRRPEKFFAWLHPLAEKIWHARPNPAHYALAALEQRGLLKAVITQNIDGLHQAAGSRVVHELHGNLTSLSCPTCGRQVESGQYLQSFLQDRQMPRCPQCGHLLKPDIVLFEEMLPPAAWEAASQACKSADLVLVAGSSLNVSPANILPYEAISRGARLIIVNYTPTYLDEQADVLLPLDVARALPEIVAQLD